MEEQRVAIIDLDSIMFSGAHPYKVLDADNQPIKENGKFLYQEKSLGEMTGTLDQIMNDLLTNSNSDGYIGFIKGKGNFRYQINPEYKANRPKESPHWWNSLKQHLIEFWGAFEVNGIEVDDACKITRLKTPNSFISSIDKDLLLLEGEAYNWRLNKWYNTTKDEAEYKFWSDMIVGQPGDNIKGIPGKGIKYVEKLFNTELAECILGLNTIVFNEYVNTFGESKGVDEFYKNYKSLFILEDYKDFVVPDLVKFSRKESPSTTSESVDWI